MVRARHRQLSGTQSCPLGPVDGARGSGDARAMRLALPVSIFLILVFCGTASAACENTYERPEPR